MTNIQRLYLQYGEAVRVLDEYPKGCPEYSRRFVALARVLGTDVVHDLIVFHEEHRLTGVRTANGTQLRIVEG